MSILKKKKKNKKNKLKIYLSKFLNKYDSSHIKFDSEFKFVKRLDFFRNNCMLELYYNKIIKKYVILYDSYHNGTSYRFLPSSTYSHLNYKKDLTSSQKKLLSSVKNNLIF